MAVSLRPQGLAALLIIGALRAGPALATEVLIGPIRTGSGTVSGTATVRLVDAQGRPVMALRPPALATEYTGVQVGAEPASVVLAPTADMATVDGSATWYAVEVRTSRGTVGSWRVQVPDSPTPVALTDLIGAASIPAGSVLAQRLPPDPSGEAPGLCVQTLGGAYVLGACAEAGGATSLLGLLDGPGEYADGQCIVGTADGWEWGACGGGGGVAEETDPVYAISPAAGIDAGDIARWDTAHGWGAHAGLYDLLGSAAAALSAHISAADPHPLYTTAAEAAAAAPVQSVAGRTGAITLSAGDVSGVATAAQGALAETAVQPASAGAAGLMPWTALGDSDDVALPLDGGAYAARLTGHGDLLVSAPPVGTMGWTVLYLSSDTGAWELSTPGAALWLDGAPVVIAPDIGETWEIAVRVLGDGTVLLSARVYY